MMDNKKSLLSFEMGAGDDIIYPSLTRCADGGSESISKVIK
jgi:hypothetical protein